MMYLIFLSKEGGGSSGSDQAKRIDLDKPRILVIGAAGNTGLPIALQLLEQGFPVTALVRKDDTRAARLKAKGARVVVGSMKDVADMRDAVRDVKRIYFCTPPLEGYLTATATLIAVALEAEIEHVVAMSQWLSSPAHPSKHTRETWLSDKLLSLIPGATLTLLNPGYFADNDMQVLPMAAQFGILMLPYGSGKNAPPSNEDMARVAAEILANPAGHEGKTYRITGPKLLSPQDIADVVGKVLGRKIRYIDAPLSVIQKVVIQMGFGGYISAQMRPYSFEYQRGSFEMSAPTDAVRRVTGREAEEYETTVRRYAASMPDIKPSLYSKFKLLMISTAAIFRRLPDSARYLGSDDFSTPAHVMLDADSPEWKQSHSRLQETLTVARASSDSVEPDGRAVATALVRLPFPSSLLQTPQREVMDYEHSQSSRANPRPSEKSL